MEQGDAMDQERQLNGGAAARLVAGAVEVPPPDPMAVPIVESLDYWRGVLAVMMEAPIPGRIVAPLTAALERHIRAAGHQI